MNFSQDLLDKHSIVDWGYSIDPVPKTFSHYDSWVADENHLPLGYMADYRKKKREDLRNYYPDFKMSISFLFSYASIKKTVLSFENDKNWNGKKISAYTLAFEGYDYHHYLRRALEEIFDYLKTQVEGLDGVLSLDVHPVLERDLAVKSGLGFFGKNSMLIHREHGSFHIIGSLLLNKKIDLSKRITVDRDHCGNCTRCIDACPTEAIDPKNRTIIADRCISTFTIELFKEDAKPPRGMEKSGGEIFGCDICQDVCPWNKKMLKAIRGKRLAPRAEEIVNDFLRRPIKEVIDDFISISGREYIRKFKLTSFERLGRKGMLKNLLFWQNSDPS